MGLYLFQKGLKLLVAGRQQAFLFLNLLPEFPHGIEVPLLVVDLCLLHIFREKALHFLGHLLALILSGDEVPGGEENTRLRQELAEAKKDAEAATSMAYNMKQQLDSLMLQFQNLPHLQTGAVLEMPKHLLGSVPKIGQSGAAPTVRAHGNSPSAATRTAIGWDGWYGLLAHGTGPMGCSYDDDGTTSRHSWRWLTSLRFLTMSTRWTSTWSLRTSWSSSLNPRRWTLWYDVALWSPCSFTFADVVIPALIGTSLVSGCLYERCSRRMALRSGLRDVPAVPQVQSGWPMWALAIALCMTSCSASLVKSGLATSVAAMDFDGGTTSPLPSARQRDGQQLRTYFELVGMDFTSGYPSPGLADPGDYDEECFHGRFWPRKALNGDLTISPVSCRNEDAVIAMQYNPPLDDPRAFTPHIPDDQDTDNDIGVTFLHWPDIIHFVDQPQRSDGGFPFITFGLRGVHLGRRDFTSPDLSPSRLRHIIWDLWQDMVRQFEQVILHFVRPQPVQELRSEGIIVIIVEIVTEDADPGFVPALSLTCDSHQFMLTPPQAIYVPGTADSTTLMPYFGMAYLCAPRGFRQCGIQVAASPIGPYIAPIAEGSLVKLIIGARLMIFGQAYDWFPDLERFASLVRESVRSGRVDHTLTMHGVSINAPQLQFRMADST